MNFLVLSQSVGIVSMYSYRLSTNEYFFLFSAMKRKGS